MERNANFSIKWASTELQQASPPNKNNDQYYILYTVYLRAAMVWASKKQAS